MHRRPGSPPGKLTEAARAWALAWLGHVDDQAAVTGDAAIAAQFAAMGAALPAPRVTADEALGIWPENWDALCAFLACETQWRVATGLGGTRYLGLDYTAVDVVMRRRGIPDEVFADLQEMERVALSTFAEKS